MTPSSPNKPDKSGVLRSLIVLLTAPRPPACAERSQCPRPEELAQLGAGTLDTERRRAVLEHLDACHDCYTQWLAAAAVLDQGQEEVQGSQRMDSAKEPHLFGGWRAWKTTTFALAASLVLILTWWQVTRAPDPASLLERAYAEAHAARFHEQLKGPIMVATRGELTHEAQAYFEGQAFSRKRLAQSDPEPLDIESLLEEMDQTVLPYFLLGHVKSISLTACEQEYTGQELWHTCAALMRAINEDLNKASPASLPYNNLTNDLQALSKQAEIMREKRFQETCTRLRTFFTTLEKMFLDQHSDNAWFGILFRSTETHMLLRC